VASARDADWDSLDAALVAQGVTTWCPTLVTGPLDRYQRPLERIAAAAARPGARPAIAGAHLEGPFLGGAPGAHPREHLVPIDLAWLEALPPIVRVVTLAPELEGAVEAIRVLGERGVVVALGHSRPRLDQVRAAVAAGATLVTHLFNGMSGLHHRDPGLVNVALVDDRLSVSLIADGVHVDDTALVLAFRAKPPSRLVLVTDAVAWRRGSVGAVAIEHRDGAPRLPDGTLAGSALTMDAAVRHVVQRCGIHRERAIEAASTNPAALLGLADRGILEPGRRADVVELDDALSVRQVWIAGEPVR
jgi:N-acetylglucosamine-6-phosphate deacetylase